MTFSSKFGLDGFFKSIQVCRSNLPSVATCLAHEKGTNLQALFLKIRVNRLLLITRHTEEIYKWLLEILVPNVMKNTDILE